VLTGQSAWLAARFEFRIRPNRPKNQLTFLREFVMDDTPYRQFFEQPAHSYHRQYEALRAVFIDGRPQKEVAEQFGFQYSTMRQIVYEFRQHCDMNDASQESPFFEI
jgi:hypothetical protein